MNATNVLEFVFQAIDLGTGVLGDVETILVTPGIGEIASDQRLLKRLRSGGTTKARIPRPLLPEAGVLEEQRFE